MIGKTFLINLPDRKDRLQLMTSECDRVNIQFDLIEGISGDNRPLAFNKSQHKALKAGIKTGEPFTIMEDDCVFEDHYMRLLAVPPDNWDMIYWGCNFIGMDTTEWQMPSRVNQNYFRLHNAWMTHCISYNTECAKWIDEHLNSDVLTAEQPIYDEWLRVNVLPNFNVFIPSPMIVYQRPDFSNIWNIQADYSSCHIRGNEYLKNH